MRNDRQDIQSDNQHIWKINQITQNSKGAEIELCIYTHNNATKDF